MINLIKNHGLNFLLNNIEFKNDKRKILTKKEVKEFLDILSKYIEIIYRLVFYICLDKIDKHKKEILSDFFLNLFFFKLSLKFKIFFCYKSNLA